MIPVETGLERITRTRPRWLSGQRIGLLCNSASVNRQFRHIAELLDEIYPGCIALIYSPQHGFFAEKQDNMIESGDTVDPQLKIPVFSLYGKNRSPTPESFDLIDLLIIDLQDVGTRVYTFIYTMSYCMEMAKKLNKKVVVLDRPNPINGLDVEGNCLMPEFSSFVGRYPIPMRHGLTIGEIALLFNSYFGIGCDLEVISMKGWKRKMFFSETGLPWVMPSPNLPFSMSTLVYPGQVLWEGTNISEGRGTTRPFEFFGAPFVDTTKILSALSDTPIPGSILRPAAFEPTSNKWKGVLCKGFQIHVTQPQQYQPFRTSLMLLRAVIGEHADQFKWKQPPYEYEFHRLPIDLIIGSQNIRQRLEKQENLDDIITSYEEDIQKYRRIHQRFCLYEQ
jgi:uncharacterized protein YbbC (DUF1343 family)